MCERYREGDRTIIVCRRSARRIKRILCVRCGLEATTLCDAPADPALPQYHDESNQGRCSMPLCQAHRYPGRAPGEDLCWWHRYHQADS